jgi:TonB family protein
LLARVYHTDDSIKDVAKYFKAQGEKAKKPAAGNALLKGLLRDNWKISKGLVRFASTVFGVGSKLKTSASAEKAETSFGVIVLDDSIVRVHLMSPHPSSPDNNKLVSGTMIMVVRERLAQQAEDATESGAEGEKVYAGREVTRRARVKSKPEPEYATPGIGGTVVLRAVFSASGKVTNIRVVSGVPGGFTEAAVKAARKISFEPAIKDGRYVSQYIQLEYHFHP